MLEFEWSRKRLAYLARCLIALTILLAVGLWLFWPVAGPLVREYEPVFKIVGYVIAPIFAVMGFVATRLDKIEIEEKATRLGALEAKSKAAESEAERARAKLEVKAAEAQRLLAELEQITTGADQLWRLRPARPFPQYRQWFLELDGAKLVTIGNLKGGVGKTTLAANFAAYVSETLHKRVLLVDLDYQGSLSNLMLQALGREEVGAHVNALFAPGASLAEVLSSRVHLVPLVDDIVCRLSQGWLIPSNYEYSRLENQLLLSWLLNKDDDIDVRYRLASALLRPDVRKDYDVIIFDMPPRMTLGSINALVASHFFFVPTVLSKLSVEAIPQFLTNVASIKRDLDLGIRLGGIIGNLTRHAQLSGSEALHLVRAREAGHEWDKESDYVLRQTIPRRTAIADAEGLELAYLVRDNTNRAAIRGVLNPLFAEMAERIGLSGPA